MVARLPIRPLEISYIQRRPGDIFATFGVLGGFPPKGLTSDPSMQRAWDRRQPLVGATLPESDGRSNYFIVMIGLEGKTGSAGPLRIHYTDADGHAGVVDTLVTVTTEPSCN